MKTNVWRPIRTRTGLSSSRSHKITPLDFSLGRLKYWDLKQRRDDGGSENVAKKVNLSSFKLNRVYLDLLNM